MSRTEIVEYPLNDAGFQRIQANVPPFDTVWTSPSMFSTTIYFSQESNMPAKLIAGLVAVWWLLDRPVEVILSYSFAAKNFMLLVHYLSLRPARGEPIHGKHGLAPSWADLANSQVHDLRIVIAWIMIEDCQ